MMNFEFLIRYGQNILCCVNLSSIFDTCLKVVGFFSYHSFILFTLGQPEWG